MADRPLLGTRPFDHVSSVYCGITMSLMYPVSLTVLLVVWSVTQLTPLDASRNQAPLILVANEDQSGGSNAEKFGTSLLNAIVLVAVVCLITFVMALLYKYRCYKVLVGWLILSAAIIFFMMFWMWLDLICTKFQIPYDLITMGLILWNFGIVGIISLFWYAHPKLQQGYLVVVSVIMGWVLTRLPEWSTWTILIFMALYDICAVLCPKGPLQLLVKYAQERNEPIAGFIYDSASHQPALQTERKNDNEEKSDTSENKHHKDPRNGLEFVDPSARYRTQFQEFVGGIQYFFSEGAMIDHHDCQRNVIVIVGDRSVFICDTTGKILRCIYISQVREFVVDTQHRFGLIVDGVDEYDLFVKLDEISSCEKVGVILETVSKSARRKPPLNCRHVAQINTCDLRLDQCRTWTFKAHDIRKTKSLFRALQSVERHNREEPPSQPEREDTTTTTIESEEEDEIDPFEAADHAQPFKLGLGDFIFYSVLVGRAAQFSDVSWLSCTVCVLIGLVGTLCSLLFFRGKIPALPALPISIFLGVIVYFSGRYSVVPFVYFLSTSGLSL